MCNDELGFLDWSKKVTERLTFLHDNINNLHDISEDDYFLLEVLHRVWYRGELPYYASKLDLVDETAVQTGLFNDNVTVSVNGTVVDYSLTEPKTEEK